MPTSDLGNPRDKHVCFREKLAEAVPPPFGLAVAIARRGDVIFEHVQGSANLARHEEVCRRTAFPLSSVSKPMTATAVMQLVNEGRLQLDAPVCDVLSDLPALKGISLSQLLRQTSGLPDPYSTYEREGRTSDGITNQDVVALIRERPKGFTPGERFEYSNANYVLLAQIIEQVMRQPYREAMRELIFEPAGMTSSFVYTKECRSERRACGYSNQDGGIEVQKVSWLTYGDGGVWSTLEDMIRWDAWLADQARRRPHLFETAWSETTLPSGQRSIYGCGWVIRQEGGRTVVRHNGGDPGFGSVYARLVEQAVGMILLSNLDGSWKKLDELADRIVNDGVLCEE